jgi:HEAT repeat protein
VRPWVRRWVRRWVWAGVWPRVWFGVRPWVWPGVWPRVWRGHPPSPGPGRPRSAPVPPRALANPGGWGEIDRFEEPGREHGHRILIHPVDVVVEARVPGTTSPDSNPAPPGAAGSTSPSREPRVGFREGVRDSTDATAFLADLAMALHRFATYPAEHPSLPEAAERVLLRAAPFLEADPVLTLDVHPATLALGGLVVPEGNPMVEDLADRLRGQAVGALVLRAGIGTDELTEALATLARDPEPGERPLGHLPAGDRPSWPHLQLRPPAAVGGDESRGSGRGGRSRETSPLPVSALWEALAEARHAGRIAGGEGDGGSTGEGANAGDLESSLRALCRGLQGFSDPAAEEIRTRTSDLLDAMTPDEIRRLAQGTGKGEGAAPLPVEAHRAGLAPATVVRLLDATLEGGARALSPTLRRLLFRIAHRAGRGAPPGEGRTEARSTLGEQVEGMLLAEPSVRPAGPRAPGAPGSDNPGGGEEETLTAPAPFRVVELALRLDEPGPALESALQACVLRGDVAAILDLVEGSPSNSRTAARVEAFLFSPERLQDLLSGSDVDEGSLRRVVDVLGDEAIAPLFQQLAASGSRSVRRKIFDRLVALGPRITPRAMDYLASEAWYVRRNMLALLQRFPFLPPGFSPMQHVYSDDVRVRREAVALAFREAGSRREALEIALGERDERLVRMALLELRNGVPPSVVPLLVDHLFGPDLHPHLRSLAVRALGRSRSPMARGALLRVCGGREGPTGAAPASLPTCTPELITALHVLARGWPDDEQVAPLLEMARRSEDSRVQAAVRGTGAGSPGGGAPRSRSGPRPDAISESGFGSNPRGGEG